MLPVRRDLYLTGGTWTHSDISAQEKARLRESMTDEDQDYDYRPTSVYNDPFADSKANVIPPAPVPTSDDDLPRYTPSETAHIRPSHAT